MWLCVFLLFNQKCCTQLVTLHLYPIYLISLQYIIPIFYINQILVGFMRGKSSLQHRSLYLYSKIGALVWIRKISLLLMSTTIYLFLQAWAAYYNKLDQTSVHFYWGLIKLCITKISRSKFSCLILFFITVLTSIQTSIRIG